MLHLNPLDLINANLDNLFTTSTLSKKSNELCNFLKKEEYQSLEMLISIKGNDFRHNDKLYFIQLYKGIGKNDKEYQMVFFNEAKPQDSTKAQEVKAETVETKVKALAETLDNYQDDDNAPF